MDVSKYLTEDVVEYIKNSILEAQGNEVFFTGKTDATGLVYEVFAASRGSEHTVPVNFSSAYESSVLIHNHPNGILIPSNADLSIASQCAYNAKGFYIVNNDLSDIYVVVEAIKELPIKKIDKEDAAFYISQGGPLSQESEFFEERSVQIELLKNVAESFNNSKIGVFEAGTGVGKSFAYLIPSALWALENKERVVISTGTINLQHQLCQKDLPQVEKLLNVKLNYILLKGRQNYICLRRLNDNLNILDLFPEETEEINKIADFAKGSATGSKSELSFLPSDNVWSKVNSESDACFGMRCPFHSECFVMKVKKAAAGANIIVVNHHLLFADIESRLNGVGFEDTAVLPPYKRVIFDEAHGIENAATSFFSESFTRFKLNKILNQLYNQRKNSQSGHLCTLALLSSNEEKASLAFDLVSRIKNDILNLELSAQDLLKNEYSLRLFQKTAFEFGPFLVCLTELTKDLGDFADILRLVMEGIEDDDKDIPSYWESKILLRRLDNYVLLLKNFNSWDEKPDNVYWIQQKRLPYELAKKNQDSIYIILNETPLDISHLMNMGVYETMKTVICTSATLKTGHDFNYWMKRCGVNYVEKNNVLIDQYESPFPYEKNMLFAVPSDIPMPEKMDFQQHVEIALPLLISAAEGRTLVLFTSYESLKSAYGTTSSVLKAKGFTGRIMKQGDDDNARLLETFKREEESVLFATDSYWQGVDVPGPSLSQVIIVKLPFTVPNDPVFVAKAEAIEKKGGNSFMELSVPEAVIKFRQGIGRLIRRSDDKGVVVVLDRRIFEKRYGSLFIASMPKCKKLYEPLSSITKSINDFIFN